MGVTLLQTPVPGERDVTINFYGTPKVPLYELEVDCLVCGEILDVQAQFVISAASYREKAAFVASQLLLRPMTTTSLTNISVSPPEVIPLDIATGFDVSVPDSNYYARFVRVGRYQVPEELAGSTQYVVAVGWASSEGAGQWDYLEIVAGYGQMSVLRLQP